MHVWITHILSYPNVYEIYIYIIYIYILYIYIYILYKPTFGFSYTSQLVIRSSHLHKVNRCLTLTFSQKLKIIRGVLKNCNLNWLNNEFFLNKGIQGDICKQNHTVKIKIRLFFICHIHNYIESTEIRTHNLPLTSPTRYPLGHDSPLSV